MEQELESILDRCLERIMVGGETPEQCLASYPQFAATLEPLLKAALEVDAASAIEPRPEFKARARYHLLSALRPRKGRFPFLSWPRWAVAVSVVLAVILVGGGTVAASAQSLPHEPLYGVKMVSERVQLRLTPGEMRRARLLIKFAQRRGWEMAEMAQRNRPQEVERLAERLNRHLDQVPPLARAGGRGRGRSPAELQVLLERRRFQHRMMMENTLKRLPPQARPAFRRAMERSDRRYERALEKIRQRSRSRFESPSGR